MQIYVVVYSAFRDFIEYREYYDLIVSDQGLFMLLLGRLPLVYKKRPALPKRVEKQILEIMKSRSRDKYHDIDALMRFVLQKRAIFIPNENVIGVTLDEEEVPVPPILRKPPSDPRETPKYSQRVLAITTYWKDSSQLRSMTLYTTLKIKDKVKRGLKEAGYYINIA